MRITFLSALILAIAVGSAFAGQDLTFEPSDTNLLQYLTFSGSTGGITGGTGASTEQSTNVDHNYILNPADGVEGSYCYQSTFSWNDDVAWPAGTTLVRATDFPDRHLLSSPEASNNIGIYVRYNGSAASMEIALSIREEPVGSGNNETYETTTWKTLGGQFHWQYFTWDLTSEIVSSEDNWGQAIGLGDGIYDGGEPGDATAFEAVMLRPIPGVTIPNNIIVIRWDDIHTGGVHSPNYPSVTSVEEFSLYR